MDKGWSKGRYNVVNTKKYLSSITPIYRSSWEYTMMYFLDHNENILRWGSEFIQIPYVHPTDSTGKMHTYYPDFYLEFRTRDDKVKKWIVEVKPEKQLRPPTQQRKTKTYKFQMLTYLINIAKWNAAKAYCQYHGLEFKLFTEREIKGLRSGGI